MNKLVYRKGVSKELLLFPHILEIGFRKNSAIQLNAFESNNANCLKIYFINEGRYEWLLNAKKIILFPGDTVFVASGIHFGNEKGILEIGSFFWIHLDIRITENQFQFAVHSRLLPGEKKSISEILYLNRGDGVVKLESGKIIKQILEEINDEQTGFQSHVNLLLDSLLISIARNLKCQNNSKKDFTNIFLELEQILRKDLARQWSLEEMASIVGMGTTVFNEKVKNFSGFTPINYLINIRISEAMKLLKQPGKTVTDIALETGFYSSQHFATTFKKLTGYTPSQFKRNH